jgi:competence protein ComEC
VDRPPHARRRPRVEGETPTHTTTRAVDRFAPFLLLVLLLLLVASSGCGALPTSDTAQPPPSGSLVVSFIDVGQGDGVLVQSGGESYLLDAGKAQAGPKVVDFLRSRGVESLDGIVVSNPDADHIGGIEDVLGAFEVANAYLSGDPKGTSTYNSFLRVVQDEGSKVVESRAGIQMDWGGTRADA